MPSNLIFISLILLLKIQNNHIHRLCSHSSKLCLYCTLCSLMNIYCLKSESESEVTQSCSTRCDPMDIRLLREWDFLGKNTAVGCHFLLQGIFLTQELNPGLLHCKWMLYHLSHQGSPTEFRGYFLLHFT